MYCWLLSLVKLPENLTEIETKVFYEYKLADITIPENVTKIGKSAFPSCSGLTDVIVQIL